MRKPFKAFRPLFLSFWFLSFFSAVLLAAQSPAPATLVMARRLLDPRTGNVLSPVAVLIENGKIKEVGAPSQVQAHVAAGPVSRILFPACAGIRSFI